MADRSGIDQGHPYSASLVGGNQIVEFPCQGRVIHGSEVQYLLGSRVIADLCGRFAEQHPNQPLELRIPPPVPHSQPSIFPLQ